MSRDVDATGKVFTTFDLSWQPPAPFLRTVAPPAAAVPPPGEDKAAALAAAKAGRVQRLDQIGYENVLAPLGPDRGELSPGPVPNTASASGRWAMGRADMVRMSGCRFLALSATLPLTGRTGAGAPLARFQRTALGSAVSLTLAHPVGDWYAARVCAEVRRLEDVFGLHRPGFALFRLNAEGRLDAPLFKVLECLSLAGTVHRANGGAFDPTSQPLWAEYAQAAADERTPILRWHGSRSAGP